MIPVKYPLKNILYRSKKRLSKEYEKLILDEVNVKNISWEYSKIPSIELDTTYDENLEKEYNQRVQHRKNMEIRKKQGLKQ